MLAAYRAAPYRHFSEPRCAGNVVSSFEAGEALLFDSSIAIDRQVAISEVLSRPATREHTSISRRESEGNLLDRNLVMRAG